MVVSVLLAAAFVDCDDANETQIKAERIERAGEGRRGVWEEGVD